MDDDRRRRVPMSKDASTRREGPLPHEALDTPEMRAKIAKAKERVGSAEYSPGKTSDELLDLARGKRVDTRT